MTKHVYITLALLLGILGLEGQNILDIDAYVDVEARTIRVTQQIVYTNTTADTLDTIYLNDWNNSYSTKSTPLAKRFEEEFSTKFHLAKNEQRGYTAIINILDDNGQELNYERLKDHPDVIQSQLNRPLLPGASYNLSLSYTLFIPDATFTDYGITKNKDFNLKYWYITPAVYDGTWHYYSNKNLDDLFIPQSDITLRINHPMNYSVTTELDYVNIIPDYDEKRQTTIHFGADRVDTFLSLNKFPRYSFVQTDDFILVSNINEKGLATDKKALLTDRITRFITSNLGPYPHKRLLVTTIDYNKNPLYGLNQLPDFIRPFPDNFQYELKLLKTALKKYLDNTLMLNPRKDYWLSDGLQIYYLMM